MECVMAANVRKRAEGVAHPHVEETPAAGTGATRTADVVDATHGCEAPQAQSPWPAEFGWDFPFDFPKRAR